MPSESKFVMSSPTKVVTNAIPPTKYVAFLIAIDNTSGPRIAVDRVKIPTAMMNDTLSIEKPSSNQAAARRPIAFASRLSVTFASNLSIIYPHNYTCKYIPNY